MSAKQKHFDCRRGQYLAQGVRNQNTLVSIIFHNCFILLPSATYSDYTSENFVYIGI